MIRFKDAEPAKQTNPLKEKKVAELKNKIKAIEETAPVKRKAGRPKKGEKIEQKTGLLSLRIDANLLAKIKSRQDWQTFVEKTLQAAIK